MMLDVARSTVLRNMSASRRGFVDSIDCVLARDAVRLLTAHHRNARRLADGMLEWRLADLPVAT
jgi:hypothetical protein